MGPSLNYIYKGTLKYLQKMLSQCHFVHHKFYVDRPRIESEPPL